MSIKVSCEQSDCYSTTYFTPNCNDSDIYSTQDLSTDAYRDCSDNCRAFYETLDESDAYPFFFGFIQFIPAMLFSCCYCCLCCSLCICNLKGSRVLCIWFLCCLFTVSIGCISLIPLFEVNSGDETCFGYGLVSESIETSNQICSEYTDCWSCELSPCGILSSGYAFSEELGSTFCIWNSNSNTCVPKSIRDINNYDFDPSCSYSVSFLTFMYIGFIFIGCMLIIIDIIFYNCYYIPKQKELDIKETEELKERVKLLDKELKEQNISKCDTCNHSFHDNVRCGVQVGYHKSSNCTRCNHWHHSSKCDHVDTDRRYRPESTYNSRLGVTVHYDKEIITKTSCGCNNCNCTQSCTRGDPEYCSCGGSRLLKQKLFLNSIKPGGSYTPKGVYAFFIFNILVCIFLDLLVVAIGICIATYGTNNIYIYRVIFKWMSQSLSLNQFVPLVIGQLVMILGVSILGICLMTYNMLYGPRKGQANVIVVS